MSEPSGDDEVGMHDADWTEWPVCPGCGQRRPLRCPLCGSSGTDFLLADAPDLGADQQPWLICRQCDDAMQPEWYRFCPSCGYDFGEGVAVHRRDDPLFEISRNEWLVAAIILLGSIGLISYFAWLFSGPGLVRG